MQRMRTVTSTLVLAAAVLTPNAGPAPAAGQAADGARGPGAALVTAQRDGTNKEAPSGTPSNTPRATSRPTVRSWNGRSELR